MTRTQRQELDEETGNEEGVGIGDLLDSWSLMPDTSSEEEATPKSMDEPSI